MTIEVVKLSENFEVINPQGVETEVGNPFPEVVRETTEQEQVLWLKSSPQKPPEGTRPEYHHRGN